jgi:hypothetical protein
MRLVVELKLNPSSMEKVRDGVPFIVTTQYNSEVYSVRCSAWTEPSNRMFGWLDALVPEIFDNVQIGDKVQAYDGKDCIGFFVVTNIISEKSWNLLQEGIRSAKLQMESNREVEEV